LIEQIKFFGVEGYIPCDESIGGIIHIEENDNIVFLPLYPNPTDNTLTINFEVFSKENDVHFSFVDILGNNYSATSNFISSYATGIYEHSIDISHLPTATYFLIITTKTKQYSHPFTINR